MRKSSKKQIAELDKACDDLGRLLSIEMEYSNKLRQDNQRLVEENKQLRIRIANFKMRFNSMYGRYEQWARQAVKPGLYDVNSLYPQAIKDSDSIHYREPATEYPVTTEVKDLKPNDIIEFAHYGRCSVELVIRHECGDTEIFFMPVNAHHYGRATFVHDAEVTQWLNTK
jgi:hypothetical protein